MRTINRISALSAGSTLSSSRRALSASASLLLLGGALLCSAPQAHADQYLVGALQFAADSTGATTSHVYQYDTNGASGATPLDFTFNGTTYNKSIAILLPSGSNTLSFVQNAVTPLSAYGGTTGDLGLYFSSTNTPYDPASGARTPDLLVSRATDGTTAFFFPTAGTSINDYIYPGASSYTYSGATSTTPGSLPIIVAGYSVDDNGSGTVTIQAGAASAATPEPGSIALLVGMGLTGGMALRRKRGRKTA